MDYVSPIVPYGSTTVYVGTPFSRYAGTSSTVKRSTGTVPNPEVYTFLVFIFQ